MVQQFEPRSAKARGRHQGQEGQGTGVARSTATAEGPAVSILGALMPPASIESWRGDMAAPEFAIIGCRPAFCANPVHCPSDCEALVALGRQLSRDDGDFDVRPASVRVRVARLLESSALQLRARWLGSKLPCVPPAAGQRRSRASALPAERWRRGRDICSRPRPCSAAGRSASACSVDPAWPRLGLVLRCEHVAMEQDRCAGHEAQACAAKGQGLPTSIPTWL